MALAETQMTTGPVAPYIAAVQEDRLSAAEWHASCLKQIEATEADINAWVYLNRAPSQGLATSPSTGRLAGLPIGLKDIIDTSDMPTRLGSPIFADRQPEQDADITGLLRQEGACILGKTVTTEFAFLQPSVTCNPHHTRYSPGGSSSGSAAAVAAGHVPVAVGSQTGGSVIRPASFCGVFGFKPSQGRFPRGGMLQTSQTLDHPGLFARTLDDIGLVGDVLTASDSSSLYQAATGGHNFTPHFIYSPALYADDITDDARSICADAADRLGRYCSQRDLAAELHPFQQAHTTIYQAEYAQNIAPLIAEQPQLASPETHQMISAGMAVSASVLEQAYQLRERALEVMSALLADQHVLILPSATAEAPHLDEGHTGNPACSKLSSLCGLPCLSLPRLGGRRLTGSNGLPVGIQLIGRRGCDEHLFAAAYWLDQFCHSDQT